MNPRWLAVLLLHGALWGCDPMSGFPMERDGGDAGLPAAADAHVEPLRLDHVQVRGTVNSNHDFHPDTSSPMLRYRHGPLDLQGSEQDIRQFDFDVYGNGHAVWVLYYAAVDDAETVCNQLVDCLRDVAVFSDAHPDHVPLVLLIGETQNISDHNPNPFFWHMDEIEESLLVAFGRERMLSPADVRGLYPDLATAIEREGWPPIDEVRGKIIAVINEHGAAREEYLSFGGMDPDDRFLWQIGDPDNEDPDEVIFSFERADEATLPTITRLVLAGRLVHTSTNDSAMAPRLREAGVHMLASRWPIDVMGPLDAHPVRCNPVRAPMDCRPERIEQRAPLDQAE